MRNNLSRKDESYIIKLLSNFNNSNLAIKVSLLLSRKRDEKCQDDLFIIDPSLSI